MPYSAGRGEKCLTEIAGDTFGEKVDLFTGQMGEIVPRKVPRKVPHKVTPQGLKVTTKVPHKAPHKVHHK